MSACGAESSNWLRCAVPAPGQVRYEAHMLDSAASPLVAALPQYERGFRDHLAAGRAYWEATQVGAPVLAR